MRLTLPQVLAKIVYRDRRLVDRKLTIFDVLNDAIRVADGDEESSAAPCGARDELLQKLRSGELAAWGVPAGSVLHEPIPSFHWEELDSLTNLPNSINADDVGREERPIYRKVFVEESEVARLWPSFGGKSAESADQDSATVSLNRYSQQGFVCAYEAHIAKVKQEGRRTTEGEDCDAFPNVPRDKIRALRRSTVPDWCVRGRPKKIRRN
jgi:hypothetical protein